MASCTRGNDSARRPDFAQRKRKRGSGSNHFTWFRPGRECCCQQFLVWNLQIPLYRTPSFPLESKCSCATSPVKWRHTHGNTSADPDTAFHRQLSNLWSSIHIRRSRSAYHQCQLGCVEAALWWIYILPVRLRRFVRRVTCLSLSAAVAVWYWFAPVSASVRLGQTKPPFYPCSSDQTGIIVGADTLRGALHVAFGIIFFFCSDDEKMTYEITIEML